MVLQHAALEITQISAELFRNVSQFIREYLAHPPRSTESYCIQLNYDPDYLRRWVGQMQYLENTLEIRNDCTVYAHPSLFEALLRSMILDLTNQYPQVDLQGRFTLYNSNWGYSHYPFSRRNGALCWQEPHLARQQPEARGFWGAMTKAGITTISELFTYMYAPMTGEQRLKAFAILDSITDTSQDEVTPWEGYGFDEDDFPEPESMTEFTYMIFLRHGWSDYGNVWGFLEALTGLYTKAGLPFALPPAILEAMKL